jgi:S1-C subfamily serine protease
MRHFATLSLAFFAGWILSAGGTPRVVTAAGGPPDFADVIARANPSVVRVSTRTSREARTGSRDDGVGGGFVVRADGLILTSRHVVAGAQRVIVTIPDRGTVDAQVAATDEATDVALLRVPVRGLTPLPFGDPSTLRVGAWVLAGGAPYALENSWSIGIVSGLHRSRVGVGRASYQDFIQTDAAANLGNSGGPLLDGNGRAVGLMTAILSRTGGHQGVGLAVPMDAVRSALARLLGGRAPARPRLGVRVREVAVRGDVGGGLVVTGFDPGSPAPRAGLQAGDVILAAAGAVVLRPADLQRLVWGRKAGDLLVLLVRRGTRRLEVTVRLN